MYAYFVIIAIALSVFGIAYTFFTYRNKERMALIESGIDIEYFRLKTQRQNIMLLSFGLIFIGFALGILSGFFFEKYLLENYNPKDYRNYPQAYLSMITLFMGMAMLVAYFINRKMKSKISR
ncbi:DUF6249 domain-containing protein [Ulvibacterium sp.]|uniref:DUF6249 domain-containing protein n=1 Tax=Ulvibacterium sp. TaxID=2665914 RepID=UPI00262634C1|nr:DUF6249 domain-containing protein [Ulvibacterium sp.]